MSTNPKYIGVPTVSSRAEGSPLNDFLKKIKIVSGFVSLVSFIVYLPSLRNGFVNWDDGAYIYENFFIRSLDTKLLKSAFVEFHVSNWHPLTWLSHAVDFALWGLDPFGHHFTSILLHSVNAFLVAYLVMWTMAATRRENPECWSPSSRTGARAILITGAVTGLLFGIHPMHVESVAWVSERKDLLCTLFFLLSLTMYARYAVDVSCRSRQGSTAGRKAGSIYLLALGFFVLALLSKPMAVSLPIVLIFLDWFPFQRIQARNELRDVLVEKIPFIALSLASSVVTLLAQKAGEAVTPTEWLPFSTRAIVAAGSVVMYIWKMLVPLDLVPLYPYPQQITLISPENIAFVAILIGITMFCVIASRKEKIWLLIWGYYTATLFPVLGLVQVGIQSMADRYTYLPSIGPFFLAGLFGASIYTKMVEGKPGITVAKTVISIATLIMLVSISYLTIKQISIWKNGVVLWSYVIEKEPTRVPIAHSNLAEMYMSIGQRDAAIRHYRIALMLRPDDPRNQNNLGAAYSNTRQSGLAMEHFKAALALRPDYPDALYNLGNMYMSMERPDMAIQEYLKALSFRKSDARIFHNLGVAYASIGQPGMAIQPYQAALRLSPDDVDSHWNIGNAYRVLGMADAAIQHYRKALTIKPDFAEAHFLIGLVYIQLRKEDLARREIEAALRIDPAHGRARDMMNKWIMEK